MQVLPTCGNDVPDPSKPITRSQSKKQKDLERRKAREKRKEKEREAKAKKEREAAAKSLPKPAPKEKSQSAPPKEKSQSAPKKMTTQIVPYDPERSKKTVQTGDLVYVKVSGEFTGISTDEHKGVPRTTVRLHPYMRVIGPFRVERKVSQPFFLTFLFQ